MDELETIFGRGKTMACMSEDFKKEVQEILDRERWQGYVSGKVDGAVNVLYAQDISKEERLELLSTALGLSQATAEDFLASMESEDRINKMMKGDIDIQREIGKQLFLVSIFHYENDKASRVGYSMLSKDTLAAWASMTKEELDSFINVCSALDPFSIVVEAAKRCCLEEPFKSEKDAYSFVLSTYYRLGDLFSANVIIDTFEDVCNTIAGSNYKTYSEKYEEYPVAEAFSTPEIFKKMMSFYIRYLVTVIKEAISEGYAWDVVSSMTRIGLSEERYNSLVKAFAM